MLELDPLRQNFLDPRMTCIVRVDLQDFSWFEKLGRTVFIFPAHNHEERPIEMRLIGPHNFTRTAIKHKLNKLMCKQNLSYAVASGSEITPCNKICKPLVVYRFTGNVITSIATLRT